MHIKYLNRSEIDEVQWDNCIKSSIQYLPYALSFYLDVVCPNWSALVVDNYEAVLPLPIRKKFLLPYVFQPAPCPQLGLYSKTVLSTNELNSILAAVPSFIKFINCGVNKSTFTSNNFGQFILKDNYELDLDQPYETIKKKYKYNTRREIKLALNKPVNFVEAIAAKQIIELLVDTKQKQVAGLTAAVQQQLVQLLKILYKEKIGYSLGIVDEANKLCAAVFYIKTTNSIINLLNASNATAKKNGWMMVLIDQLIRKHANTDTVFDFEGSSIPSVARFFRSFGAVQTNYYVWQWNRLPFLLRWLK